MDERIAYIQDLAETFGIKRHVATLLAREIDDWNLPDALRFRSEGMSTDRVLATFTETKDPNEAYGTLVAMRQAFPGLSWNGIADWYLDSLNGTIDQDRMDRHDGLYCNPAFVSIDDIADTAVHAADGRSLVELRQDMGKGYRTSPTSSAHYDEHMAETFFRLQEKD